MGKQEINNDFGSVSVFYEHYYRKVLHGGTVGARAVRITHEMMERSHNLAFYSQVLEIGGRGEHLDFIRHSFDRYLITDIQKPILNNLWENDIKVVAEIADAEDLPFQDSTFDRVIATCLLHHVSNPEKVLGEILRVLKPAGVATIFLSCDPGVVTRILRSLTTARSAKQEGFAGYHLMNARDHRNHVASLLKIAKYVFRNQVIRIRYYPFRLPSWNLNGFIIIEIG